MTTPWPPNRKPWPFLFVCDLGKFPIYAYAATKRQAGVSCAVIGKWTMYTAFSELQALAEKREEEQPE